MNNSPNKTKHKISKDIPSAPADVRKLMEVVDYWMETPKTRKEAQTEDIGAVALFTRDDMTKIVSLWQEEAKPYVPLAQEIVLDCPDAIAAVMPGWDLDPKTMKRTGENIHIMRSTGIGQYQIWVCKMMRAKKAIYRTEWIRCDDKAQGNASELIDRAWFQTKLIAGS